MDNSNQHDASKQICKPPVEGLCSVCQICCVALPGAQVIIGDLDDIQSRLLCKMCSVMKTTIENHYANRIYETDNIHQETFLLVPQSQEQSQTQLQDKTSSGCTDSVCPCHISFRIDARSHYPSRPISVIRFVHAATYAQLGVKDGPEDNTGMLDVALACSWLHACENGKGHDRCNLPLFLYEKTDNALQKFLVVDVDRMCLAEVAMPLRYFALSYVWGDAAKMFMTVRANVASLTQPGALTHLGDRIPLLIRDVFLFMQKLGERYLWVDSLCIVQDDDDKKRNLIGRMDYIYAEAACTLVIHGALGASFPIQGVRDNTRKPFRVVEKTATTKTTATGLVEPIFICASPCHYASNASVYNTRGWTFQELILSRKRIVLGADQMFFSCQSQDFAAATGGAIMGGWCEDPLTNMNMGGRPLCGKAAVAISFLNTTGKKIAEQCFFGPDLTDMNDTWKTQLSIMSLGQIGRLCDKHQQDREKSIISSVVYIYTSIVALYSRRKLSYTSDILNAFSGIQSFMERSCGFPPGSSIYGLLAQPDYFRSSLHWIAKHPRRRTGWPSWSWVGWDTDISFLERSDVDNLEMQIQQPCLVDKQKIRPLAFAKSDANTDKDTDKNTTDDKIHRLLPLSNNHPVLTFWAQAMAPKALWIRFHPIHDSNVRILTTSDFEGSNICGHVHESFAATAPFGCREITDAKAAAGIHRWSNEEWDRCRLVYLSHSPRRCVYHLYTNGECAGSCNSFVVMPPEERFGGGMEGILLGERIGMAEVCGNKWRDVAKTREFVALI